MLCKLLLNSVSEDFHVKILANTNDYDVMGHKSGCLVFKVMMAKAIVNTKATSTLYRERLMAQDEHMVRVKSDIAKFNQYVRVNMKGLEARGEAMDDVMISLFKMNVIEY